MKNLKYDVMETNILIYAQLYPLLPFSPMPPNPTPTPTFILLFSGYYPSDNFEALLVDEIMGVISDITAQAIKAYHAKEFKKVALCIFNYGVH